MLKLVAAGCIKGQASRASTTKVGPMLKKTNSRAKLLLLQRRKSTDTMDDYTKRLVLCFSEKLDQAKVGYIDWNSFKLMAMVSKSIITYPTQVVNRFVV